MTWRYLGSESTAYARGNLTRSEIHMGGADHLLCFEPRTWLIQYYDETFELRLPWLYTRVYIGCPNTVHPRSTTLPKASLKSAYVSWQPLGVATKFYPAPFPNFTGEGGGCNAAMLDTLTGSFASWMDFEPADYAHLTMLLIQSMESNDDYTVQEHFQQIPLDNIAWEDWSDALRDFSNPAVLAKWVCHQDRVVSPRWVIPKVDPQRTEEILAKASDS